MNTTFYQVIPFHRVDLLPPGADREIEVEYDEHGVVAVHYQINDEWVEIEFPFYKYADDETLYQEAEAALAEYFAAKKNT